MLTRIVCLVALAVAASANEELWKQFKVNHSKTYSTEAEHQLRYAIFAKNLEEIEAHNQKYAQGLVSWYMKTNHFADLTAEEFKQTLTAKSVNQTEMANMKMHVAALEIPNSIDWRRYGVVTEVKNQGNCGSCWTFSTTGSLEAQYALKYRQLISLSEQDLLDCCTQANGYNAYGCEGGFMFSAMEYVRDHGIIAADSYPYRAVQQSCRQNGALFYASGYAIINVNDENHLLNAVGSVGPVSIALNADLFQFYGGGIFSDTRCSMTTNHGVLIVGYGSENGQRYWIVKNSWSSGWGEAGYIRMAMGYNLCGLASQACYPIL